MTTVWLVLITGVGCVLRFVELGREPLWTDEGFMWLWIHLDHARIWGDRGRIEYNPPFYYSLQRLWLAFGDSEFAMRSLSALLGTATIPVVFLIGRTVANSGVGLVAALLLATQPVHVAYSQEARVYALLCFGAVLAILGLVGFLRATAGPAGARQPSPVPSLATYAVGVLLCLHSHNTGVFVPMLAGVAAFAWWLGPARRSPRFAALWVAANAVAAAPWLFWLPVVVHQALESGASEGLPHYTQPDPARALFEAARMLGVRYIPDHRWRLLQAVSLVPLLACAALLLRRPERPLLSVLAICGFGLPVLAFAIGYVVRPVYNDRILIWFIPPLLVLAAAAIRRLPAAWLRSATLSAALAPQLAGLAFLYATPQKEPWSTLAALVRRDHRAGDAVLLFPSEAHGSFAYYARREQLPEQDFETDLNAYHPLMAVRVRPVDRGTRWIAPDQLAAELRPYARIWLVARKLDANDSQRVLRKALAALGSLHTVAELAPGPIQLLRLDVAVR